MKKPFNELPLISMPEELKDFPSLPENEERVLRALAHHAIEIIFERLSRGEPIIKKKRLSPRVPYKKK